jgi:hypothetical protein
MVDGTIGRAVRLRQACVRETSARRLAMGHHFGITGFEADALFVSALQGSQAPTTDQVRQAVDSATRMFGPAGCAGRVAQEFGDHPEIAAARMRWARETLAGLAYRVRLAA